MQFSSSPVSQDLYFIPKWIGTLLLIVLMAGMVGCAAPIGVAKLGPEVGFKQINLNILNSKDVSVTTWEVLHRFDLLEKFEDSPIEVLAWLRERACSDTRPDLRFALAELSYAEAVQTEEKSYYLQSSIYAYLYLFNEQSVNLPDPYDRRFRMAIDLYNRALAQALSSEKDSEILLASRSISLPLGQVDVKASRPGFPWGEEHYAKFLSADNYKVRGLRRYREAGLGIPLIALPTVARAGEMKEGRLPPSLKIPATAFLRVSGNACDVAHGAVSASLELYLGFDVPEVRIGRQKVPLEVDLTTPLAYTLDESDVWNFEIAGFFGFEQDKKSGVFLVQPYQPGKIPVVFIHGTASSPARWAEMLNGLRADPLIRKRFQFWGFIYSTGNPIVYSASLLRDSIKRVVHVLDPKGKDPALNQMVLIGHSQGGLLAKMMVIEPGDQFWKNISDKSPDELDIPKKDRDLLKKALFFDPLPFVKNVVFVATPHRGSFVSKSWIGRFFSGLVSLPADFFKAPQKLIENVGSDWPPEFRGHIPTSVENMSPNHPFIRTLSNMPIVPGVQYHSIIAVKGDGDPKAGNDGVVEYSSAHLEDAASEYIVRSVHSAQAHPLVIEEVRRILLEDIGEASAPVPSTSEQIR
jgi:pimeloyl-ACP methyl ester carboxylesterase